MDTSRRTAPRPAPGPTTQAGPVTVAVLGGTGTLGRHVVDDLRARGHRVRALSRHSAELPVDLGTGRGLAAALDGCDVVVDAANAAAGTAARATLVEGTGLLLDTARDVGVSHVVSVTVVGCEAVPMAYFAAKAAQQQIVEHGPLPWSTVRSTQFHDYVVRTLRSSTHAGLTLVPRMTLQPVDVATVARLVADAATRPPTRTVVTVAGPETRDLRDLARSWRAALAPRALLVPVPVPGAGGRALRAGALTTDRPDVTGTLGFDAWLAAS